VRLGVGFDSAPVPLATLGPFLPDTDRVFVSAGLGYRWRFLTVEASYLAAVLLKKTAETPDLQARWSTVGHVVSAGIKFHFSRVVSGDLPTEYRE
jgi:long-subunit fatty acid transport protein